MDVWMNTQFYEGECYSTVHLTKQGALVSQIEDLLEYYCASTDNLEAWKTTIKEWDFDKSFPESDVVFRQDIVSWREWTTKDLDNLRETLVEGTFDCGNVMWWFEKTNLLP